MVHSLSSLEQGAGLCHLLRALCLLCPSGGDLSPLDLADVNGDGLRDVLLSFVPSGNRSAAGKRVDFGGLGGKSWLIGGCEIREALGL